MLFPVKLWQMLHDPSCASAIRWTREGTRFIVHKALLTAVLTRYFQHGNFASFQRQLR